MTISEDDMTSIFPQSHLWEGASCLCVWGFHLWIGRNVGIVSAAIQLDLFENSEIRLEAPYRLNQKDWKPTFKPFAKARKRVETLSSQLDNQFMVCRNYAKQQVGLFARIISKISALTILQYINFINNKPLGQIKHALL